MRKKNKYNNSSVDNITLRTISSKNKTINYYDNNELKYSIDHSKSIKSKKAFNNKENYDIKKTKNNLNTSKNIIHRNKYNNLSSLNYAKSLNLMINNHTQVVNTQFSNYNKFKFQNKNDESFQMIENNRYKYNNIHLLKNEEKENMNSISKKKVKSNKNIKSRNKKKNNGYSINHSVSEFSAYDANRKVIIIQAVFRGYYIRNKLYNTILLYTMIKKFIFIFHNKLKIFKKIFFNNFMLKGKERNDNNNNFEYEKSQKNIKDRKPNMNNIQYFIYNINNINNINIEKENNKVDNLRYNKDNKNIFRKEKGINKDIKNEFRYESKLIMDKNIENQKNEDEYDNVVIQKKEKKDIYKQNKELLLELNSIKEKYEKLLNERNKANFIVSKSGEINIEKEKNKFDFDITKSIELYINKENESKSSNTINNINIIKKKKNINPNFIKLDIKDKNGKEKYLSQLFNRKVEQYEGYIHKCFGRFYYNGIFLQMTGKLDHLNKNSDNNENINKSSKDLITFSNKSLSKFKNKYRSNASIIDLGHRNIILVDDEKEKDEYTIKDEFKINNISNINHINLYESVNINTKKDEKAIKEEKERSDLKERLRKSRGLRKLMNKKASEKQELLRYYFFKFYRAGLFISRFKAYSKRRRSCQLTSSINIDLSRLSSKKALIKVSEKELNKKEKKEEDSKEKLAEMLQKIFYKTDRRNMVIKSKVFKKFYLKAKLESLKDVLDNNKDKKKKKKLKRRNTTAILKRNDKLNYFKGERAKSAEIEIED